MVPRTVAPWHFALWHLSLQPKRQFAADLQGKTSPASGTEPDLRTLLLEAPPQQEQAAFEIVLPFGQLQLEVGRIGHALRRAEELPSDVAAAIEAEAG